MEELIFKTICKNEIKTINKYSLEIITNEDLEFLNTIKKYTIDKYNEYSKSKDSLKYYFLNKIPNKGMFKLSIKNDELIGDHILNFQLFDITHHIAVKDKVKLYILINKGKQYDIFYYILVITQNTLYNKFIKPYFNSTKMCTDKLIDIFIESNVDKHDESLDIIVKKLKFIFKIE